MKNSDEKKIDVLRFYREEIRHEFALLGTRMTWYVTCQSFLLTAFAILAANNFLKTFPWFNLCVALLGVTTSYLTISPVRATHETIAMWLKRQRQLFPPPSVDAPPDEESLISLYAIPRDYLSVDADRRHGRSLIFSRYITLVFIIVWLLFIALGLLLYLAALRTG